MLNLSRIQLELEKAKEGLREVEETIQKVEGKAFSNGPGRYSGLKVELHSDKGRNLQDDGKTIRRRIVTNSDSRNQRISADDLSYTLKRGPRDKRDGGPPAKRQPQSIFARLSGRVKPAEDEDDDDFQHKKPALPSHVITTSAEAPSRQEVIAAQTADEKSQQRNRRMFSALVGTLQKFRKEETRVREREEKRQKVEKKLEEDAKREREKLMQEKKELFLERKRREVEIKRIEWSLNRVKEYEAWEANVLPLKNFIQTQAKPHIFYLPHKHNHKTEERLAQSQKIVEKMIERRKTNLKEEIENSERKARRIAVTEETEEEEAENIPQDDDDQVVEQQMEIDFDAVDKENGYHDDGPKDNLENLESATEQDETMHESINEEKPEQDDSKTEEEEIKETVTTENEDSKMNESNDDKGGGQIADEGDGGILNKTENDTKNESDSNITTEVPMSDESELKNVENKSEDNDLVTENPIKPEEINLPNEEPVVSEDKKKEKENEASRRRDRSRSRKAAKRSKSSRSPRRSRSRTPRSRRRPRKSRSSSRSRRRTNRRRSRSVSVSPPKKSRRSGSGRRRTERKRSESKSPSPKRQTKSRASSSSSKSHSN